MMKFCELFSVVISITNLLTIVDGSCFIAPSQRTVIGSKEMVTCEYERVKFLEGSNLKTTDCFECYCSSIGLRCCGFGFKAGVIAVPNGYKVVQDGCDLNIVEEDEGMTTPIDVGFHVSRKEDEGEGEVTNTPVEIQTFQNKGDGMTTRMETESPVNE